MKKGFGEFTFSIKKNYCRNVPI